MDLSFDPYAGLEGLDIIGLKRSCHTLRTSLFDVLADERIPPELSVENLACVIIIVSHVHRIKMPCEFQPGGLVPCELQCVILQFLTVGDAVDSLGIFENENWTFDPLWWIM